MSRPTNGCLVSPLATSSIAEPSRAAWLGRRTPIVEAPLAANRSQPNPKSDPRDAGRSSQSRAAGKDSWYEPGTGAPFMARLLDQTTQPFAVVNFTGRIIHANRAIQSLLGYTAEEMLQLNVLALTPERERQISLNAFQTLTATGQAQRYEKSYLHRDGHEIAVELVTDFFLDERGEAIGYYAFVTDISGRKMADQALRASEERFRRLYDEAPFGYHDIDVRGTIVSVNRTECELLGYQREEMLGRSVFDFLVEEEREGARVAVSERVRGARPVLSVERTYLRKDGRRIPVAIENRALIAEDGQLTGFRSTVRDISAEKQTQEALVVSEKRARALFEGIEDAVFVHDPTGRILDANPAACRTLGYSREELLQLTTHDIDDPEFAAGYNERLAAQLQHGHLRCEGRHRTKDGRIIPVDINTSTILFENQKAVLAVIRDITERKALEETRRQFAEAQLKNAWEIEAKNRALVQSEARYRRLTEGCLDAIVLTDQYGRIILFNPAAESTFGYTAVEIVGRPFIELMPEDLRGDLITGLQDYIRARAGALVGHTLEMRGCRKNGEVFPVEVSLSAIEVAGELQFLAAIRDQGERQRMRAMLMQSEKLASIGLLSAGVAHEINNPLAYIANNLAVLERDVGGIVALMNAYESAHDRLAEVDPGLMEHVQALSDDLDWPYVRDNLGRLLTRTRDGVQRVANIVQNLRGMARTAPPKMEPVLLSDLVSGALDIVQGRLRHSDIEVHLQHDSLPKIACVPSQIGQVFLNLLVNSVQAIEELHREAGNWIHVTIEQNGSEQCVEIADNGCGIPAEALPRLFDPFFTTKPVGEGTGLGLSISHGIVTGHGGRIDVESAQGVGTRFRVCLPARRAVSSVSETSPPA
jgi:PAS domain S-box-containing protein